MTELKYFFPCQNVDGFRFSRMRLSLSPSRIRVLFQTPVITSGPPIVVLLIYFYICVLSSLSDCDVVFTSWFYIVFYQIRLIFQLTHSSFRLCSRPTLTQQKVKWSKVIQSCSFFGIKNKFLGTCLYTFLLITNESIRLPDFCNEFRLFI